MRETQNNQDISLLYKIAKKKPFEPKLHYAIGVALHKEKKLPQAIEAYHNTLELDPKFIDALENLAEAQAELKLYSEALTSIRSAISLNPKKAICHARLCRILICTGQLEQSIEAANNALYLDPQSAVTYFLRSNAYRALNQLDKSISDLRQAVKIDPKNPEFPYALSFDLLLNGQFDEGWSYYESRFQTEHFIRNTPQFNSPLWTAADSLKHKTILVCAEQGLGDQIQFARYALILMQLGAKVIILVDPPLVEIIQSMHPDVFVTSSMQSVSALPHHDYHVPLMSLMGIFKTDLSNIPFADHYLTPNISITKKWAERFREKKNLQIGITWSGSKSHVNDHNRSMSLAQLLPLFNLDVDWHILQTEIRPTDEILLTQTPLHDWRPELTSLHETAGLLDQLDLLITVDTSVAHLSAALGKPTWIMLPYTPDFRWLLNRSDSPWYPTVQLFRQLKPQDWTSVVSNIFETLTRK